MQVVFIAVCYCVRRMQRESTRSADLDATEQRITVMLISVVVVFLVCQLPQAIQKLYTVYLASTPGALTTVRQLQLAIGANFCNLLVMVNSAVNFVLYSAFSAKFRLTFERTFCCCRSSTSITDLKTVPLTSMVTFHSDQNHHRRYPQTTTTSFGDELVTAETSGRNQTLGLLDGAVNS